MVFIPDVRPDFPLHEFQFVEPVDRAAVKGDGDSAHLTQTVGIQEAQFRRAVAHNQIAAILGQSPTFTFITKL